jgi:hypothetical protein
MLISKKSLTPGSRNAQKLFSKKTLISSFSIKNQKFNGFLYPKQPLKKNSTFIRGGAIFGG